MFLTTTTFDRRALLALTLVDIFAATLSVIVASIAERVLAAFAIASLFVRNNDDVQSAFAKAVLMASAVGASLHAIGMITGSEIRHLFSTGVPLLRPDPSKLRLDGEAIGAVVPFIANRTSAMLAAAFCGAVVSASFSNSLLSSWLASSCAMTALLCRFAIDRGRGDTVDEFT